MASIDSIASTRIIRAKPKDVTLQSREPLHGQHHHHHHTDSYFYSERTSRRTDQQQPAQGMLIEQDGVLIYVPFPSSQQGDDGQRSQEGGGGGGGGGGDGGGHQYGSTVTNNNDDNDNYFYGDDLFRPQSDDQVFETLDCSQYIGMDDPPIECLPQGNTEGYPMVGDTGFGDYNNTIYDDDQFVSNSTAWRPQNPETGDGAPVENMTVGTGMVDTTFIDDDSGGGSDNSSDSDDGSRQQGSPPENLVRIQIGVAMSPPPSDLDSMNHILSEVVTAVFDAYTPFHSVYLGNLNPPVDYRQRQLANQEQQRLSRQLEPSSNGQPHPTSSPNRLPVDLIHAWTTMLPTSVIGDMVWYWTNIDYAALIGSPPNVDSTSQSAPPPRPIRKEDHIGNITLICQSTINRTIANDVLLHRLVDAIQNTLENAHESGDAAWLREQLGLVAIAPIGITGLGQPEYVADLKERSHTSYTTPLDLEFGLREWLGLALAIGTLLVTLFIFGGASYYHQRQDQKQWSTALMTEHGINDILKVGWQYHQQAVPNNNGQPSQLQPQLFLHVFEKQAFRSDDDSILHGGVEREELDRTGGILLVHDEGSREDDSSSSNRQSSSRASAEQTQPTTPTTSIDRISKR